MKNLTVRVAEVENCYNGRRSNPFKLEDYENYPIEWFIKEINDEVMQDFSNHFVFLIDVETRENYTY